MSFHYVKLDSEDRCEVYMSDYTKYQVYLWGVTEVGDGAEWLDTPYDVTPGTGSVWEATTDLAAQFTNTPEVVFLLAVNAIASQGRWGCQDIDGPDRYGYHVDLQGYEGGVTFCTSGECELWTSSTSNLKIYAVGALTSGAANKFSSSYDATASNVWEEDIDETANMGANDLAIIYHYHDGTGTDDDTETRCITRQAGQTWDDWTYQHGRRAVPRIAPVNPSDRKFDIKVENEAILAYIYGSIRDGSTQPPGEIVTHYYNDIAFP